MKKVAIINSVYKTGSTGRIAFELQHFLKEKALVDPIVFFGRGQKIDNGEAYNFSLPGSFFIHVFLSRIFDRAGFYSYFSTKRLIKRLIKEKVDVLFLMNLHGYYLNIKLLLNYARRKNIKVFYRLSDCWSFTGHCSHFELFNCNKWEAGCNHCKYLKQYPKSILFDNSKKNYSEKKKLFLSVKPTLLLSCNWMNEIVSRSFFDKTKRVIIRNGVDTSIFKKVDSNIKNDLNIENKKIILCVSQYWIEKKGIYDIIKLSNIISNDYQIILIGRLNVKVVLSNNIIHIPFVGSAQKLAQYYSSADVLFNPTYEDTYPNVNVEATACGLPIVCYKTGGAVESVDSKCVVEQGDLEKSYQLIKELCNNPSFYAAPTINVSKQKTYLDYMNLMLEQD